jgi:ADP-heptose:LPS heptosyltransferase
MRCVPALDRFFPFPGSPGIAEQFYEPGRTELFLSRMRREGFDLAIQLHGSGAFSNPITLALGARVTAGMVRPGDSAGRLDAAFPTPQRGREVDRLLAFTSFLGAPVPLRWPDLQLEPGDESEAARALSGATVPLTGVHPGAREATKRWPAAHFAGAAEALWQERGGTVVVLGGPEEEGAARIIEKRLGPRCLNLAGRLSLPVLAAVVRRLALLLTNDSGPAHLAYAMGTPSVTIFGGTDAARWGPAAGPHRVLFHEVPCRPCQGDSCPLGFACLEAIPPRAAVEAARQVCA